MRVIKFRAWDETYGSMMYSEKLDEFFHSARQREEAGQTPPVMQFTGLKDKNGKEVYEGDILAENHGKAEEIMVGKKDGWQVVFCWGTFKAFRVDSNAGNQDSFWLHERCLMNGSLGRKLEVIGNIYENPDLLK